MSHKSTAARLVRVSTLSAASTLLLFTGCQSWSSPGYSMTGPSRVPPPGTGTYPLPQGYYNNAGPQPSQSTMIPPQAGGGVYAAGAEQMAGSQLANRAQPVGPNQPAASGLPTTKLSSANGSLPNAVQPAGYQTPAEAFSTGPALPRSPTTLQAPLGPPPGTAMAAPVTDPPVQTAGASGSLTDGPGVTAPLNWQTP